MAQKPYQEDGDKPEDYEFHDENEDIDYEYQDEDGGKRRFKWRRLLIFLIIVLAILWFFYHQYEHKRAVEAAQKEDQSTLFSAPITKKPVTTPKAVVPPPTTATSPSTTPQQSSVNADLSAQLAVEHKQALAMEAGINENRRELVQLRTEVANIGNRVNMLVPEAQQNSSELSSMSQTVKSNQAQITQQLGTINQELSDVTTALGKIEAARKSEEMARMTAHAREEAAIRHRTQYYVQAVIPGRAWLKATNGDTTTVAIGDLIDGYGKILAIDPYSGDVVTSSGVIIKYGLR